MILKTIVAAVSLAIAVTFCWFGYDGARAGIMTDSGIAVLSGFVFFCYGLGGILLLIIGWVRGTPIVWWLAVASAIVPFVLAVVSFGQDGFRRAEWVGLLEVTALLVLHVFTFRFIIRDRCRSPVRNSK